jgi:hypothetical protein
MLKCVFPAGRPQLSGYFAVLGVVSARMNLKVRDLVPIEAAVAAK